MERSEDREEEEEKRLRKLSEVETKEKDERGGESHGGLRAPERHMSGVEAHRAAVVIADAQRHRRCQQTPLGRLNNPRSNQYSPTVHPQAQRCSSWPGSSGNHRPYPRERPRGPSLSFCCPRAVQKRPNGRLLPCPSLPGPVTWPCATTDLLARSI